MRLFAEKPLKPKYLIKKLVEAFPEKELKILNSCSKYDFYTALIRTYKKDDLVTTYTSLENVLRMVPHLVEAFNKFFNCKPFTEKELDEFCLVIIQLYFCYRPPKIPFFER